MYGPFSNDFNAVMIAASKEARGHQDECIGTVHLLVALLMEQRQVAGDILRKLGVDAEQVRQSLETLVSEQADGRAKSTIEHAMAEARSLKHEVVGPEHLLLGLLREHDGVAARVLMGLGVTLEAARAEVLNYTREQGADLA